MELNNQAVRFNQPFTKSNHNRKLNRFSNLSQVGKDVAVFGASKLSLEDQAKRDIDNFIALKDKPIEELKDWYVPIKPEQLLRSHDHWLDQLSAHNLENLIDHHWLIIEPEEAINKGGTTLADLTDPKYSHVTIKAHPMAALSFLNGGDTVLLKDISHHTKQSLLTKALLNNDEASKKALKDVIYPHYYNRNLPLQCMSPIIKTAVDGKLSYQYEVNSTNQTVTLRLKDVDKQSLTDELDSLSRYPLEYSRDARKKMNDLLSPLKLSPTAKHLIAEEGFSDDPYNARSHSEWSPIYRAIIQKSFDLTDELSGNLAHLNHFAPMLAHVLQSDDPELYKQLAEALKDKNRLLLSSLVELHAEPKKAQIINLQSIQNTCDDRADKKYWIEIKKLRADKNFLSTGLVSINASHLNNLYEGLFKSNDIEYLAFMNNLIETQQIAFEDRQQTEHQLSEFSNPEALDELGSLELRVNPIIAMALMAHGVEYWQEGNPKPFGTGFYTGYVGQAGNVLPEITRIIINRDKTELNRLPQLLNNEGYTALATALEESVIPHIDKYGISRERNWIASSPEHLDALIKKRNWDMMKTVHNWQKEDKIKTFKYELGKMINGEDRQNTFKVVEKPFIQKAHQSLNKTKQSEAVLAKMVEQNQVTLNDGAPELPENCSFDGLTKLDSIEPIKINPFHHSLLQLMTAENSFEVSIPEQLTIDNIGELGQIDLSKVLFPNAYKLETLKQVLPKEAGELEKTLLDKAINNVRTIEAKAKDTPQNAEGKRTPLKRLQDWFNNLKGTKKAITSIGIFTGLAAVVVAGLLIPPLGIALGLYGLYELIMNWKK